MQKKKVAHSFSLIVKNSQAKYNYFIEETIEAGIVLQGTEVKSIRDQSPQIRDAFVEIRPNRKKFEAFLLQAHIQPYRHGNIWNHEPVRKRKLLLHQAELVKLNKMISQKGKTIIPLQLYFKKQRVKVELGIGRGKKAHDKRETLKKKSISREIAHVLKKNNTRSSF